MRTDAVMCIGVMSASPSRMPLCASAASTSAVMLMKARRLCTSIHSSFLWLFMGRCLRLTGLWQIAWLMPASIDADPASTAFSLD